MFKEVWLEYRKQFYKMLFLFLLLLFAHFMIWFTKQMASARNEKKVETALASIEQDNNLSQVSKEELEALENPSLSPTSKGRIYQLLAETSFLAGNKMDYITYAAYAFYYYQKADYSPQMADLYSQYAGRLYENGGFDSAKELLDQQNSNHPVAEYTDKEEAVKYYLFYADVEEIRGDYMSAQEKLEQAKDYLDKLTDSSKKDHSDKSEQSQYDRLLTKYQLLTARLALLQEKTDTAFSTLQSLISDYNGKDAEESPSDDIPAYDNLSLSYHEIMGKILLLQGKETEALKQIDIYLQNCIDSNYNMMQYRMLKYMLTDHPNMLSEKNRERYQQQFIQLSDRNISYLSTQYCNVLLDYLGQAQNQLITEEQREANRHLIMYALLFLIYAALILCMVIQYCMIYIHTDSLTRLTIRSQYEHQRTSLERRKIPYFLLILDIDDFKAVNDTYGHLAGDVVLRQIASIVKQQLNPKDHAFRYGGEEFCVILREKTLQEAYQVADNIRAEVQLFPWKTLIPEIKGSLSISGGLAEAKHGKNPFQKSDQALYYSKGHGKNQITSYPYPDAVSKPITTDA